MDAENERDALRNLLLEVAATGRDLTNEEIRTVRQQVAQAGYDPTGHTPAGGRLAGLSLQGQILTGKTRVRVGDAHYLRHVVMGQEWPVGTTFAAYLESLRQVVRDPQNGILLDQLQNTWQLTFAARSGRWRGPSGDEWIIVAHRINYGYWVTGFQPRGGLDHLTRDPGRHNQRWLVPPE